tara:strand:+ start:1000 stop:1989 length:990 start_codon:yes stop_codon:yes gene_type:complete
LGSDAIGIKNNSYINDLLNLSQYLATSLVNNLKIVSFSLLNKGVKQNDFVTCTDLRFKKGDLGNQLFKYAVIRKYSFDYDVPILLPHSNQHRLGEFKIECEYYDKNVLELFSNNRYYEKHFHYNSGALSYAYKKDFYGYYQTEKYFIDIKDILFKELELKDNRKTIEARERIQSIRENNPEKKIVSIHVRRGDFVPSEVAYSDGFTNYSPKRYLRHPLMPADYYRSASQRFENAIFLIFSDTEKDIKWCKENLGIQDAVYYHNEDLIDFKMMQLSDHNIISNSTFSWWSAWLNGNKKKRIISPKKENWFGKDLAHYNMDDLIPTEWEQL